MNNKYTNASEAKISVEREKARQMRSSSVMEYKYSIVGDENAGGLQRERERVYDCATDVQRVKKKKLAFNIPNPGRQADTRAHSDGGIRVECVRCRAHV